MVRIRIPCFYCDGEGILNQGQDKARKRKQAIVSYFTLVGHTPVLLGLSERFSGKNSAKTLETLSELFLEFPSRVRLGSPKPYTSRHLKPPEHFQNYLPLSTAGDAFFSEVVPERASQSRLWNSQQHWGYFWKASSTPRQGENEEASNSLLFHIRVSTAKSGTTSPSQEGQIHMWPAATCVFQFEPDSPNSKKTESICDRLGKIIFAR